MDTEGKDHSAPEPTPENDESDTVKLCRFAHDHDTAWLQAQSHLANAHSLLHDIMLDLTMIRKEDLDIGGLVMNVGEQKEAIDTYLKAAKIQR